MADIRNKGIVHNLIVSWKDTQVRENVTFANAQIDQSNLTAKSVKEGTVKADTNPYLMSVNKETPDGKKFVDHSFAYTNKQIEAMKQAAGSQFESKDGVNAIRLRASVMPKDKGLMINTEKPMGPSTCPNVTKKTPWTPVYALNKQQKITNVARDMAKAQRSAMKSAEAQAENQAQTQAEAPALE